MDKVLYVGELCWRSAAVIIPLRIHNRKIKNG